MSGRYNPLAEGHVEMAGTLGRLTLWRITRRAMFVAEELVEPELRRLGYQEITVDDEKLWISKAGHDAMRPHCKHEIDLGTLAMPQDLQPGLAGANVEIYLTVACSRCGASGTFTTTLGPGDIVWEGEAG